MDITTGMVIISAAGHDKGQWFLVTGVDGRYAYLADGKERKLAAPEKEEPETCPCDRSSTFR